MKVRSGLADLEIGIGAVRRDGDHLVLRSSASSSVDTEIVVSAGEVVRTIGLVLSSASGWAFVLGLPWFWLRQRLRGAASGDGRTTTASRSVDVNKPW
jgi:hypothetical protein